jgi:hypothetical protein
MCLGRLEPGHPGLVDLAAEPWTAKWNTEPAEPARCSVIRRQWVSPIRAAPLPARPSRTKSTKVCPAPVGQRR